MLSQYTWPELRCTIFRHRQYPLGGIASDALLQQAVQLIAEGRWYGMVAAARDYATPCTVLGSGNSHQQLQQDLAAVLGQAIRLGADPFACDATTVATCTTIFTLTVTKNQNYYEPYAAHPEGYQWLHALWHS